MSFEHPVERFREQVQPAIQSKVEELHLLGYNRVTEDEVWNCLMKKVWKKKQEKMLHEVVNDILTLSVGVYMNFLSVKALTGPDLFAEFENDTKS